MEHAGYNTQTQNTDLTCDPCQCREKEIEHLKSCLLKEKEENALKSRFVSLASHEFRTPLSSIQLSASLIEHYFDRLNKKKILDHLQRIKSSVDYLVTILNDFLSVERIETGALKVDFEEFDLKAFMMSIVTEMKPQAKEGQKISYTHIGTKTKCVLDKNLLRHCLLNVISNAIKYSRNNGIIQITTNINPGCSISVKDNGIGIPADEQDKIFNAFFRASNTLHIEGTGLGLNIVKHYTRLMGGTAGIKSTPEKGTIVVLNFPFAIDKL